MFDIPWPGEVEGKGTPAESKAHMETVLMEGSGHWVGSHITWTFGNWKLQRKKRKTLSRDVRGWGGLKGKTPTLCGKVLNEF